MFKNHWVDIDPRSVQMGGSWQGKWHRPEPRAWDPIVIEKFYNYAKEIPFPFVLDIGANTGSFCLLAKFHPGMKVYAFEPNPATYEILQSNIALNGLEDRVGTFPIALSDKTGVVSLYVPVNEKLSGASRLDLNDPDPPKKGWNVIQVMAHRLDDLGLGGVDIIKLDVEGHEFQVLAGGGKTIQAFMPALMVEWQQRNKKVPESYRRNEMERMLVDWGYINFGRVGRADRWITI